MRVHILGLDTSGKLDVDVITIWLELLQKPTYCRKFLLLFAEFYKLLVYKVQRGRPRGIRPFRMFHLWNSFTVSCDLLYEMSNFNFDTYAIYNGDGIAQSVATGHGLHV
jgi:hypothetical protein